MGELLMRRREMILPDNTPILPADYQRVEYIERPSGTDNGFAWSDSEFKPSNSDTTVFKIGCMVTATPSGGNAYFFAGGRDTTGDYIGIGLGVDKAMKNIGLFGGSTCYVQPNGGSSFQNMMLDVVATRTPTYCSTVCNGYSNRTDYTPRNVSKDISIFLMHTGSYYYAIFGRIYYFTIENNGVVVRNFVPCRRISDGAKGFYETVAERFTSSSRYALGPDVT